MSKALVLLIAVCLPIKLLAAPPATETTLKLKVTSVHDGDTLTGINEANEQVKVWLDAIDAPEFSQPYGQASRKALAKKVFGKVVTVTTKKRDQYRRVIGHVPIDGRDVNLEMLEEGMAWHYEKYDHNKRLWQAEHEARADKRGLWQDRGGSSSVRVATAYQRTWPQRHPAAISQSSRIHRGKVEMSQEPNRSLQSRPIQSGGTDAGILIQQVHTLIEGLPESSRAELMKGFTGDLLQLAVKVQEIQATNAESRDHLSALADLLNNVKRDGNRGYVKHTSVNPGGQTTIEIGTGGGPLIRPFGGGCAVVLAALIAAGTCTAVIVCASVAPF